MRRFLSFFYPLSRFAGFLRRERDRWRYHWLCRRHDVRVYPTGSSKLSREILALDLFRRATERSPWVPRDLYPGASGAADHKFLYVLVRALEEYRFRNILELGAGETTRVLDAYAAHSGASVTTIEHDADWIARLSRDGVAATHHMVHAPLTCFHDERAGDYWWYDRSAIPEPSSPYELMVIDGPPGTPRWSRYGALSVLKRNRAPRFLVLWDDVDRVGELQTFGAWLDALREEEVGCEHHLFVAERTLGAVYSPEFRTLRYFF